MTRLKKKLRPHRCTCETCQQHPQSLTAKEHRAINRVLAGLDEKNRRQFVGLLARQWGHGGIARLIAITGLSRNTIKRGQHEIERRERLPRGRVRASGAGRPLVEKNSQSL